jgi:methionine-gamma-lyase
LKVRYGVTGKRPGGAEGLIYSRFNGPNQEILEDRLAVWEDADDALAFSSGMAAIATLLLTFVRPGDCVVHSGPLYAATETLIAKILGQFGVSWIDFPSGATREEIKAAIAKGKEKGRVSLVYLESPANPTNQLVDVEAVRAAVDAAFPAEQRPPIAIDNTFLGPLWAKPLDHGADISVYSLTKYAGGHSDLVAGGLVGKKALIDKVRSMRNTIGTICDPNTAWMLLRSLETLELRMSKAGDNAAKVCAFLRDHPKVAWVTYPGLEDHPSKANADEFLTNGYGGVVVFGIEGGREAGEKLINSVELFSHLANVGDAKSLIIHPASTTHSQLSEDELVLAGIGPDFIRLAVGIEDPADILADLTQALEQV